MLFKHVFPIYRKKMSFTKSGYINNIDESKTPSRICAHLRMTKPIRETIETNFHRKIATLSHYCHSSGKIKWTFSDYFYPPFSPGEKRLFLCHAAIHLWGPFYFIVAEIYDEILVYTRFVLDNAAFINLSYLGERWWWWGGGVTGSV